MAIQYVQRPFTVTKTAGNSSTYSTQVAQTSDDRILVVHTLTDNGSGGFIGDMGTVAYADKTANFQAVRFDHTTESYKADYEDAKEFSKAISDGTSTGDSSAKKGGEYSTAAVGEEMLAATSVVAKYRVAPAAPQNKTFTYVPDGIVIDLLPLTSDPAVPGSIRFAWMGQTYDDYEGVLYRGRTDTDPGIPSGTMDYDAGKALMYDYVVGPNPQTVTILSLWTRKGKWKTASTFFRTVAAPVKPTAVVISLVDVNGGQITVNGDALGNLSGDHAWGSFDYLGGCGQLLFGDFLVAANLTDKDKAEWWYNAADVGAVQAGKIWRPWPVDPTTIRISSVTYVYLPIDSSVVGLQATTLPADGKVPIFRVGNYACLSHTEDMPAANLTTGGVVDLGRERVSRVHLIDGSGNLINSGYLANLNAGLVNIENATGWVQPVVVRHSIEQLFRLPDVQINGAITLDSDVAHNFPMGSVLSSALVAGDLEGNVSVSFTQASWTGVWADARTGNAPSASYDFLNNTVAMTNKGSVNERWAIVFTGQTSYYVMGEHLGVVATGDINSDCSPPNPQAGGAPYFVLPKRGFGLLWASGNVIRFNTVSSLYALAAVMVVQAGSPEVLDHHVQLLGRVDVDRLPS